MAVTYPSFSHLLAAHYGQARAMRDNYMVCARHMPTLRQFYVTKAREWHRDAMKNLHAMRKAVQ